MIFSFFLKQSTIWMPARLIPCLRRMKMRLEVIYARLWPLFTLALFGFLLLSYWVGFFKEELLNLIDKDNILILWVRSKQKTKLRLRPEIRRQFMTFFRNWKLWKFMWSYWEGGQISRFLPFFKLLFKTIENWQILCL